MNKKDLSERDICSKFIGPAVAQAGWDPMLQVREEVSFTNGRIIVRGKLVTRGKAKRADYILYYKPNIPIAIIEAKDNNHSVGDGIQQALGYAATLKIPFVFSSNGDGFLFHDCTGNSVEKETDLTLDQFPSPAELWERYRAWKGLTADEEKIVLQDYFDDGNPRPPVWICAPRHAVASTRDGKSSAWGRLLEWHDPDGVRHEWAMPNELLQGDGIEVRRELARQGLSISPVKAARELLATYLQVWRPDAQARCVDRLGWHGGVYVLPGEVVGHNGETVVFQNACFVEPAFSVAGTAEDWRDHVATLAQGNSRLELAICVAFAGPLLELAGEDSGGFHLHGPSSTGKTTALKVGASVWGRPEQPDPYWRSWRMTTNGLEGLAALHNDGLLILDELSQADPREVGEAAYLLANGLGKARAARNGTARQSASWRLLFLSSGEETLSAFMARAGQKPTAGQEIRLAEIAADAGAGLGSFEELHGCANGAALALAVKDAASRNHGAVGAEWLRLLVRDRSGLVPLLEDGIRQFVTKFAPQGCSGQVARVAQRFGLVAMAGEIATSFRLTGWSKGESTTAVGKCFSAWLDGFGGTGNREELALLAHVRRFFDANGTSRFQDVTSDSQRIIDRAGFCRPDADNRREFLVLSECFRSEVCKGFDSKYAAKILRNRGWLVTCSDRLAQKVRLPGMGPTWVYVIGGRMWEWDAA